MFDDFEPAGRPDEGPLEPYKAAAAIAAFADSAQLSSPIFMTALCILLNASMNKLMQTEEEFEDCVRRINTTFE